VGEGDVNESKEIKKNKIRRGNNVVILNYTLPNLVTKFIILFQ